MSFGLPFDFEMPVNFFEKADAEPGKERRIGGICTLETKDQQDEVVLARGLDFSPFLQHGWFNDNHSRETADILGYPEKTKYFRKGERLPDGSTATAAGHWVEGYLLKTKKADRIWELGRALQETNRRLGFSVEGKVQRREGPDNKTVANALVRNVAITNCPVHAGTRLEILAKSLQAVAASEDPLMKMLGMGPVATPGVTPTGVQPGMGAGQVIAAESLEQDEYYYDADGKKRKKKTKEAVNKALSYSEAYDWYAGKFPQATPLQLMRVIAFAKRLKANR